MRMHEEEVPDAGKPNENGEPLNPGAQETPELTISQKYRELKSRLKYLIYERGYFESELNKVQGKLLELSQDKTVLLDHLLQYEPVSGEEEEVTDYSASEDETPSDSKRQSIQSARQQAGESSGKPSLRVSGTGQSLPAPSGSPQPPASKSAHLTKQGIAKATAILNSVSNNAASKVSKAGTKRQAKPLSKAVGGGTAVKISKTVSRVRQNNLPDAPSTLLGAGLTSSSVGKQKLVVSYPITSISSSETGIPASSTLTTLTVTTVSTSQATPITSKPLDRPIPALTKPQAPPSSSSSSTTSSSSSSSSSALQVSNLGNVHVATVSTTAGIPPLIPGTSKGHANRNSTSSTSSTSSSSSSSGESGESGSDMSSGSEDEAMDTVDGGEGVTKGPVRIVSSVKSADNLPRPKAILSPVKMTPPMLVKEAVPTPPPAVVSPQPAFSAWNQSQGSTTEGNSPLALGSELGGFAPLVSPLTSPPSVLPFSSLNPGVGSAFQVFSPKRTTPPSQTTLTNMPFSSPSTSVHTAKTTPTARMEAASQSALKS